MKQGRKKTNIIRAKVLAEEQKQHILYGDVTDTCSAFTRESKTGDKDASAYKEEASDTVPR